METTLTLPKKNDFYNPERSMYVIPLEKGDLSIELDPVELDLSNKHLSDEDVRLIFQVFENDSMRTNLKRINLSRNSITSIGISIITDIFKLVFPVLESLDFSYNAIGDKGLELIVNTLRKQSPTPCPYIRFLDVTSNNITTVGAVYIHKLIRRSDGSINVMFDSLLLSFLIHIVDNPIDGEGLSFIFSSKYWESFNIINTNADDSFSLFVKSYGTKALNVKHLKIMHNHLSPSSIQLLPSLFSSLPIPSLQTLIIDEVLRENGMNAIIQIGLCRSMMSLKQLTLQNCAIPLPNIFSLIRAIDQGSFPMLRSFQIIEENCYEIKSNYQVKVDVHVCLLLELTIYSNNSSLVNLSDFYLSTETQEFKFKNEVQMNLQEIFNPTLLTLSLHNLTKITISHIHVSITSLYSTIQLLPISVQTLTLDNVELVDSDTNETVNGDETPHSNNKITHLILSNINSSTLLMKLLFPLLSTLSILEITNTPFTDENVLELYEYTRERDIQLVSLCIDNKQLSDTSLRLISLIAPSIEKEEEKEIDVRKERCHCIIL